MYANAVRRWAMLKHGMEVYNPCQLLQVWHNHASDVRKNQNSTFLGHLVFHNQPTFPCPPQLFADEDKRVIFTQCIGKAGQNQTILLDERLARELLFERYNRKDETRRNEL
jgi:hypothetical protein